MSARGAPLRLFVAAYPPRGLVERLQRERRNLVDRGVRAVPDDQVHLTLQFIGPTPPNTLDDVIETINAASKGVAAFTLRPERLTTLPERGRPRVVVAETNEPPMLLELHRRLAHRLAKSPRPDPSDRYRPHLTLARYRPGNGTPRVERALAAEPFEVGRMWLMRSVLKPSGAEHAKVQEFELQQG